ncbi:MULTISPECIES: hypothetical protein [unclassified Colwellia]|jgi:uncharacterized membrane protein|uniref:hypothetical protein n=2 Tax=unclassified Colwellia TaxID=196834 RepID=UPI0015F51B8A|nr:MULTISPECIES: hypothetical protein [unclassified Colwellia]MBA6263851.1 hypothetical protein [Colwellia sp. Bg11-12]MBA6302657.1 hypothetical protein [Colwellia sp. MB02u-14]
MDNQFKISGWAFTIYGAVATCAFLFVYILGISQLSNLDSLPTFLILLINILLVVNFLAWLCGIYLLKQSKTVHKIALPLSIIILLSFPFGTIVGGIYLMQRFKNT